MQKQEIMLSICMIVKNEERCLERCLKSMTPLREQLPCEVIVTDTGSTDRSVEIAEKYADRVLHFEWCNDFSAARNVGIEQAKGEWVMVLDADEEFVEDVSHLVKFFTSKEKYQYTGSFCKLRNCFDAEMCNSIASLKDYTGGTSDFLAYRIFRRDLNPRYVGIIHEYMPYREPVYTLDLTLYHDGYAFENEQKRKQKKTRNASLLEKAIKQNMNDLRAIVHILVEEDVINKDVYKNLILLTEDLMYKNLHSAFAPNAFVKVANYYYKTNDLQKSLQICGDYIKKFRHDRYKTFEMDVRFIQAVCLFKQKQYGPSVKMIERYNELMEKYEDGKLDISLLRTGSLLFCSKGSKEYLQYVYARCCMEMNQLQKAGEIIKKADLKQATASGFYNFYLLIVRLSHKKESGITLTNYYPLLLEGMERELPTQKKAAEDAYNMVHSYIVKLPQEDRSMLLDQISSSEEGKADLWKMIQENEQRKKEKLNKVIQDTKDTIKKLMAEPSMKDKALDLTEKLKTLAPDDEEIEEFLKILKK